MMNLETSNHPMEHAEAEEQQLVDRYLLGQLPTEESQRFEVHYLSCAECMERLELTETLLHGLRRAAAQDAAKLKSGFIAAVFRRRWVASALAVALLLVPSGLLFRSLQQRTGELNTVRSELASLQEPQGGSSYLPLNPLRNAGGGPPSHHLRLPSSPGWVVLSLELDPLLATSYRAALFNSNEEQLWESEDLYPNTFSSLVLTLPSTFLAPGDYFLVATPSSGSVLRFPFRVLSAE